MKWFAETTDWKDSVPNGIYLLDDSKTKMYAFRPGSAGNIKVFRNPIRIDVRGRKFVVNPEQFATGLKQAKPEGQTWTVKGSKGDEYVVEKTDNGYNCSCSGFRFRGSCKHVKEIEAQQ